MIHTKCVQNGICQLPQVLACNFWGSFQTQLPKSYPNEKRNSWRNQWVLNSKQYTLADNCTAFSNLRLHTTYFRSQFSQSDADIPTRTKSKGTKIYSLQIHFYWSTESTICTLLQRQDTLLQIYRRRKKNPIFCSQIIDAVYKRFCKHSVWTTKMSVEAEVMTTNKRTVVTIQTQ